MSDQRQRETEAETSALFDTEAEQRNLRYLREIAEREELAAAVSCLANASGCRLRPDEPLAPLAREVAQALTEAGFTLHHCVQHDPLYRLGGVCLLPIASWHDPAGRSGVAVSWTTHDLLSRDWSRYGEYRGTQSVMNAALGQVLAGLGFEVGPFGGGGAWLVTGRRGVESLDCR